MSITSEQRSRVLALYVAGYPYRKIVREEGVSLGSVENIVRDERKRVPDLDELRDFSTQLRNAGLNLLDAKRGAAVLDKAAEMDASMDDIEGAVDVFKSYGERSPDAIQAALRLMALERAEGRSYGDIIRRAERASKARVEDEVQVAALRKESLDLKSQIQELKPLLALQRKLDVRKISLGRLDAFIDLHTLLEEEGFDSATARILAGELGSRGLSPQEAGRLLASSIDEYKGLDIALETLKGRKSEEERKLRNLQSIYTILDGDKNTLVGEIKKARIDLVDERNHVDDEEKKLALLAAEIKTGGLAEHLLEESLNGLEKRVCAQLPVAILAQLLTRPKPGAVDKEFAFRAVLAVLEGLRSALPPGTSAVEDKVIRTWMESLHFWLQ